MHKTLTDSPEELINYFLVHNFNHAKLEAAITEIAKSVLSSETMAKLLVKDDKYDKKGLLFALFKADPDHIIVIKKLLISKSLCFHQLLCGNFFPRKELLQTIVLTKENPRIHLI